MPRGIIIGADPAGLAIAREMLRSGIRPLIIEPTGSIAGRPCLCPNQSQPNSYCLSEVVGELYPHYLIQTIYVVRGEICSLHAINNVTGELTLFWGDYFYSSLPMHARHPL
jgi:flavin-dependent dehydrogenase